MADESKVKSVVMDAAEIERSLTRIAHQILEKNKGAGNIAIVGIVTRGDLLAKRLVDKIEEIEGVRVPLGRLDISFYRDDFASYLSPEVLSTDILFNLDGRDIVLVDVSSGEVVEGSLKPSSDSPTHLELYRAFPKIGGVTHTHSTHAVAFAQAGRGIPPLGTTHADYFYGEVPCTRQLAADEVRDAYERNTGKVIVEAFEDLDPSAIPGALVRGHGPFTWGKDAAESVYHAVVLEEVARMAHLTLALDPSAILERHILNKHYLRKHGVNAYYGQSD